MMDIFEQEGYQGGARTQASVRETSPMGRYSIPNLAVHIASSVDEFKLWISMARNENPVSQCETSLAKWGSARMALQLGDMVLGRRLILPNH